MTEASLKHKIMEDVKAAMRAKDKPRLETIRLIQAAIKQREVDERVELGDADVLAVLDKMVKTRRESISQFEAANRQDLADKEKFEVNIIQEYLPEPLSEEELNSAIKAAIESTGAASMKDMGKVMGVLKPKVQGRADMGMLSQRIKALLNG